MANSADLDQLASSDLEIYSSSDITDNDDQS